MRGAVNIVHFGEEQTLQPSIVRRTLRPPAYESSTCSQVLGEGVSRCPRGGVEPAGQPIRVHAILANLNRLVFFQVNREGLGCFDRGNGGTYNDYSAG